MPEISLIVLTFNSAKFIRPCLDSVFSQNYREFETIVVDNGSKDDTVEIIKENYPDILLIGNRVNLGAAKARNQGIAASGGRWILALDCDTVLEKDFLDKMMVVARGPAGQDSIGGFQPKIMHMDRKRIYSCGIHLSKLKKTYDIGRGRFDRGQFGRPRYVFGACSAAALYKREMLEDINDDTGYFDERFFFLAEDVDLSLRAQRKGWKTLYCPQAVCYHRGASSFPDRRLRQFLCWRNRKLLLEKCRLNRLGLSAICLIYDLPHLLFLLLTNSYVRDRVMTKGIPDLAGIVQ